MILSIWLFYSQVGQRRLVRIRRPGYVYQNARPGRLTLANIKWRVHLRGGMATVTGQTALALLDGHLFG